MNKLFKSMKKQSKITKITWWRLPCL